ncbi:MAG: carboxylesterase family protein [Paraglaciecola sp.]|nr:carboxylesterase family protein [Paraglaciecola sp.]
MSNFQIYKTKIIFNPWILLINLFFIFACQVCLANDPLLVQVNAGNEVLVGKYTDKTMKVAAFKGIPYAASPAEERRWQAPKSHQPRPGKQWATKFSDACFQDSYNTQWYQQVGNAFGVSPTVFNDPNFSEDCLYLNIWTPSLEKNKKLPVMVWIHGGSNKGGWSFEKNYIGNKLADKGQVVVVSIGYRLGVFGFFSHPELASTTAPANFGLLDQISALKWIKKNIKQFGGDNSNITLFGESAGAANIGNLMLSPLADSLFHRAISQSGGFQLWNNITFTKQQKFGNELAKAFGIQGKSLALLKELSAEEIFNKAKQQFPQHYYGATINENVLPDSSLNLLFNHKQKVDLLIGSNQDEWLMYLDNSPVKLKQMIDSHPEKIREHLKLRAQQENSIAKGHDQASTLIDMVCPAYAYAEQIIESDNRAFVYRFKRVRPSEGGRKLQAYHGAEIPYVFDSRDHWLTTNKDDITLTTAMIRYWSNFAKNGDPNDTNQPKLPYWPQFNSDRPMVQALSKNITSIAAPDFLTCQKIFPYLKQKSQ